MTRRIIQQAALAVVVLAVASASAPARASYIPRGSYVATCRHIRTEGPDLFAVCTRIDGSWNRTRIFVPACRGDVISNWDGHLRCGE